jgi:hypothetical protein
MPKEAFADRELELQCEKIPTVEKDIPLAPWHTNGGKAKYPFKGMEIGDSFAVDAVPHSKVSNAARSWAQNHGGKFTVRKMPGTDSFRCWRVK